MKGKIQAWPEVVLHVGEAVVAGKGVKLVFRSVLLFRMCQGVFPNSYFPARQDSWKHNHHSCRLRGFRIRPFEWSTMDQGIRSGKSELFGF